MCNPQNVQRLSFEGGFATLHWVFGYGSLIWRPGFRFVSSRHALLRGLHRGLCIYSHHYRGTAAQPGLVFGLMPGGACKGVAFGVSPKDWPEVQAYLREREQISGVYLERQRMVRLDDGTVAEALVFVADVRHSQYAGRLDMRRQFELVQAAHGEMGPNVDYVMNTAAHLEEMGIADRQLFALRDALRDRAISAGSDNIDKA
jgi:glutathione-specific gamma-glutamylcyclotransferase